ncbi:hypothetical protein KTAU_04380 [Thermogemmatispora aurantia]|uniref:Uncharacterized protein n=1 Tax=Thermogemmatispora aurantia TaxID=2045279 RepID=A0A5J4K4Z8_9CHLR|nr:hypothetical protein KTAU_04380 [Thermogemmatispora aurantia]
MGAQLRGRLYHTGSLPEYPFSTGSCLAPIPSPFSAYSLLTIKGRPQLRQTGKARLVGFAPLP